MDFDIPGIKPTWVISFKESDPKEQHIQSCNFLGDQCDSIAEAASKCAEKAQKIHDELHHLEDVVNDFREFMRRFEEELGPDDPPP